MKCGCGKEFKGRVDRKFCSDGCRKRLSRTERGQDDGLSRTKGVIARTDVRDNVRDKLSRTGVTTVDLVKDLGLDMEKDLGLIGLSENGIFIRPDITVEQVRNVYGLVAAKNGWPKRDFVGDGVPYSVQHLG